ncbi:hypothetical protein BV898_00222 [Hypsibius exemplaris]|uniref:PSI domain-containing protein n=1 Tax=Hypsibius exemplaris TaxID=2072580 RepID=A0A1W0XF44_HYPEX|nr:hypothetical protein BV898_00222 [Hypsibius exemplaris]
MEPERLDGLRYDQGMTRSLVVTIALVILIAAHVNADAPPDVYIQAEYNLPERITSGAMILSDDDLLLQGSSMQIRLNRSSLALIELQKWTPEPGEQELQNRTRKTAGYVRTDSVQFGLIGMEVVSTFSHGPGKYAVVTTNITGYQDSHLLRLEEGVAEGQQQTWTPVAQLACICKDGRSLRRATAATTAVQTLAGMNSPVPQLYVSFLEEDVENKTLSVATVCRYSLTREAFKEGHKTRWEERGLEVFRQTRVTALEMTSIGNRMALIMQEAHRLRVISAAEFRHSRASANVELILVNGGDSGELQNILSMAVGKSGEELFVLTDRKVMKYDLNRCARLTTCSACTGTRHNDLYCGWCVLENRCSTSPSCTSAFDAATSVEKKLWLKDFTSSPASCPQIRPMGKSKPYALDATWRPEDVKVEFSVVRMPTSGNYLTQLHCLYQYGQGPSTDLTAVEIIPPLVNNGPFRYRCSRPVDMVTKTIQARSNSSTNMVVHVNLRIGDSPGWSLAESSVSFFDCQSIPTCDSCRQTSRLCSWSMDHSSCQTRRHLKPTNDNTKELESLPGPCPTPVVFTPVDPEKNPRLTFNHPKRGNNASVTFITFSGNYLEELQADIGFRNIKVAFGSSPCQVTTVSSQALLCVLRNVTWTGSVPIVVRFKGIRVPCDHCSFEMVSPLLPSVGIRQAVAVKGTDTMVKGDDKSGIDITIMVLPPVSIATIFFIIILSVLWKTRVTSLKTGERFQDLKQRLLAWYLPVPSQPTPATETLLHPNSDGGCCCRHSKALYSPRPTGCIEHQHHDPALRVNGEAIILDTPDVSGYEEPIIFAHEQHCPRT